MATFCLALMVLATLAYTAPPAPTPVAPPPRPGIQSKVEEDLRPRIRDFSQALLKGDYDEAVKFVDPDAISVAGADPIKDKLKQSMDGVKGLTALFGRKINGVMIRHTKVNKEKEPYTAQVELAFVTSARGTGTERHESEVKQNWVYKNKTWYFLK